MAFEKKGESGVGRLIFLRRGLGYPLIKKEIAVVWIGFQSDVIIRYGQRVETELLPGESAQLISFGLETVPFDSGRAIGFCPFVVVKIQFGEGSVEVRVGKIWFSLDRLVEILDGEHIVFHREDISPDHHHLLGVDLRACR